MWQDMVPPAVSSTEARAELEKDVKDNLAQLHNHPSITTWVLFNEGWGAYDGAALAMDQAVGPFAALERTYGAVRPGTTRAMDQVLRSFRSLSPAEW